VTLSIGRRPPLYTGDSDRYFDYCLQPYQPRRPTPGKLRSENLLWRSADLAGVSAGFEPCLGAIRRGAGRDLTVFGIKHQAGRLWWELYFYDTDRGQAALRAADLPRLVAPHLTFTVEPRETLPYFMVSFDLFPDLRPVDALNYYLPLHGVQGGRSYKLWHDGRFELENVYRFYHPKLEVEAMLHDLRMSAFVDYTRVPLSRALLPELFACNRVCVAKKRLADAAYYSGIDVEQLLFFLRRFDWPAPLVEWVQQESARLDHLRFDVGFDFVMDDAGRVGVTKTSIYGTL
jgi:hypothetical protein